VRVSTGHGDRSPVNDGETWIRPSRAPHFAQVVAAA
jgi:hypothetical protein